jgi:DNA-directed RNA polymerase specialized sigma24 family protein
VDVRALCEQAFAGNWPTIIALAVGGRKRFPDYEGVAIDAMLPAALAYNGAIPWRKFYFLSARRKIISAWRKERRHESLDKRLESPGRNTEILELVLELPEDERELIVSHYYEGLPLFRGGTTADRKRVSRLHRRALTRLREMLT